MAEQVTNAIVQTATISIHYYPVKLVTVFSGLPQGRARPNGVSRAGFVPATTFLFSLTL
jgi:hypothetical protein